MNSYRGKPVQEVKPALERGYAAAPSPAALGARDFQRMVEVISAGGHLR